MFEKLKTVVDHFTPLARVHGNAVVVAKGVLDSLVHEVAQYSLPGVDKKAAVMEGFGVFYDTVISNLPLPYLPGIVSRKVFSVLRPVALAIASEVVEYAVSLLPSKDGE